MKKLLALALVCMLGVGPACAQISAGTPLTKANLDAAYVNANAKGANSGVATLDSTGKVPLTQLPTGVERTANKGVASGYASLDSSGLVPSSQLPVSGSYKGSWNATANTPAITSSVGANGDFYIVGTAGTTTIDGISSWAVGDQIRFNGSVWQKIASNAAVSSVAGRTGAVLLGVADVTGAAPIDSPAFTNNPTAVTQAAIDNSTKLATDAFANRAATNATSGLLAASTAATTYAPIAASPGYVPYLAGIDRTGASDSAAIINAVIATGGAILLPPTGTIKLNTTVPLYNNGSFAINMTPGTNVVGAGYPGSGCYPTRAASLNCGTTGAPPDRNGYWPGSNLNWFVDAVGPYYMCHQPQPNPYVPTIQDKHNGNIPGGFCFMAETIQDLTQGWGQDGPLYSSVYSNNSQVTYDTSAGGGGVAPGDGYQHSFNNIWLYNGVQEAGPNFRGKALGFELDNHKDCANWTSNNGVGGTQTLGCEVDGITISGSSSSPDNSDLDFAISIGTAGLKPNGYPAKWGIGLTMFNVKNLFTADMQVGGRGLAFQPPGYATTIVAGGTLETYTQNYNGASSMVWQRFTDTSPTGTIWEVRAANPVSPPTGQEHNLAYFPLIAKLDVLGQPTFSGVLTIKPPASFGGVQPVEALATFIATQNANNQDMLVFQRFTDTAPTGDFIRFVDAANMNTLAYIDINGAASFAGVVAGGFAVTGGFNGVACTAGTVNATTMVVKNGIVTHC
jgi:hypothetical protein